MNVSQCTLYRTYLRRDDPLLYLRQLNRLPGACVPPEVESSVCYSLPPPTQWSTCILYRTKNADKDCHKNIFHKPYPGLSTEICKITNPHHIHRTEGLVSRSPALQLHSTPTSQL